MTCPDPNNTGAVDSDLDAHFSHLSMHSPHQTDGGGEATISASFWPATSSGFIPDQAPAANFPAARPPSLTDAFLAAQTNTAPGSLGYGQQYADYADYAAPSQAYWPALGTNGAQAGPSDAATAAGERFACTWNGCPNTYRRQCDLEYVPTSLPYCSFLFSTRRLLNSSPCPRA